MARLQRVHDARRQRFRVGLERLEQIECHQEFGFGGGERRIAAGAVEQRGDRPQRWLAGARTIVKPGAKRTRTVDGAFHAAILNARGPVAEKSGQNTRPRNDDTGARPVKGTTEFSPAPERRCY